MSITDFLRYAPAGLISGVALTAIFRSFASLRNTRKSMIWGAAVGLFVLTPVIALLLVDSTDASTSSEIVLAFAAAGGVAMGGAIYGVTALVHDAFTDWRRGRSYGRRPPALGGANP